MKQTLKMYNVIHLKNDKLAITGKGTDKAWAEANLLDDFNCFWDKQIPSKTEFKALWANNYLFFCFKVYDSDVHIEKSSNTNKEIGKSDRVELFFRRDPKLKPYYCLEIDPTPRIMDFKAYPNKNFDFNWSWPRKDIDVKSKITNLGYTVEGKISIDSLKKFNLISNSKIEIGIFRAKYNKISTSIYEPSWISWVNPNTETPNFHIPSSFGVLNLKDF